MVHKMVYGPQDGLMVSKWEYASQYGCMARKMVLRFAKWIYGSQNGFMVLKMVLWFAKWFMVRQMVVCFAKCFFFWLENGFTVRKTI